MSTKYAKARDAAGQWKQEYRKQKEENTSLRKILRASLALCEVLDSAPITPSVMHQVAIENLKREIKSARIYGRAP